MIKYMYQKKIAMTLCNTTLYSLSFCIIWEMATRDE